MHYADSDSLSITRRRVRTYWAYFTADGNRITEREEIDRLNAIGMPPAYEDVRYAGSANAHLQAIGLDARGRRQYRYHPDFTARRNSRKFDGCAGFGHLLPKIRERVERDLAKSGLTAERAIASILRLLDGGRIRVGNESYAQENGSFGATTLRRRHAKLEGNRLALRFKAKSGKQCALTVTDRGLVRFVKQMQDLPGQHLFQYKDEQGEFRPVTSSDVNAYIHETMGAEYTAKDFRTWAASVLAFEWLLADDGTGSLKAMLAHVAEHLGNTPAIARKSYIHPLLLEIAKSGRRTRLPARLPRAAKWLTREELGLVALLEKRGNQP